MGRNSGGVRGSASMVNKGSNYADAIAAYKNDYDNLQTVKESIMSYSTVDRWNKNSSYSHGFNDEAQGLVEKLAKGDYGLATTIAKQAVDNPNWDKYGARFSEKQSYVMAKAAIDNELTQKNGKATNVIWDGNVKKQIREEEKVKRMQREANRKSYEASYKRSSTKVEVGSEVFSSKNGRGKIERVITASSGYVSVRYENGVVKKEMAFNLNGADGNPLRKKPAN